jgi:dihydroorotase
MRNIFIAILVISLLMKNLIHAQEYHIVIKGGHVIDPRNKINEIMDIAVQDRRVIAIGKNIDPGNAKQVVNAKGLFVTPGLIDIHVHVFNGTSLDRQYSNGPSSVPPDGFTFRTGVTTVVDAGCAGWRNFADFKKQTIDRSQTRVLAFLNIVGEGMRGDPYEQDLNDMDAELTAECAKKYPEVIVGIKLAHYNGPDWIPVDRTVEAGKLAGIPVMVDFGRSTPPLSIEELFFKHLRPGDIFTHCYAQLGDTRESIVDTNSGQVKPFVWEAVKRGIVMDVGYGGISLAYSQAIPAVKNGFYPQAISTDLHIGSMNGSMKDMLTTMSKFLAMGMDLQSVIKASTLSPAQIIKHVELGNLSVGSVADIAILNLRNGKFGLVDYTGFKIETDKKLECEMTIRAGRIVYDLNGSAEPVAAQNKK